MPSHGFVTRENAQPFVSRDLAFAHNGTMQARELMLTCAGLNVSFDGDESDSRLMFEIIKRIPLRSSVALLKEMDDNFVLVSRKLGEVYIIGRFEFECAGKKSDRVVSARNKYSADKWRVITNLDGVVKESKKISTYIAPAKTYTPTTYWKNDKKNYGTW